MKKAVISCGALMLLVADSARAQSSAVQVGVDVGAAVASIVGGDNDGSDSRTSPYVGASLVVHKPGSAIGFQTGLLFVPKGATLGVDGVRAALEINYIEVPLLLRLGLPLQGSKIIPSLLIGGSLGLKASCNITAESGSQSSKIGCDDSVFEGDLDLKTIDFGLSAGAEVAILVGERFFLAPTIRYTRGLTVIGNTTDNADSKNSTFQFGAMFRVRT